MTVSKCKYFLIFILIFIAFLTLLMQGCSDDSVKKVSKSKNISDVKMPDKKFEIEADDFAETPEDETFDPSKEYTPEEYSEKIKTAKTSEEINEFKKYYNKSVSVKGPGNAGITVLSVKIGEPKAVIRLQPTQQKDGKIVDLEVKTATVIINVIFKNTSEYQCKSVSAQMYLYNKNNDLLTQESLYTENISPHANKEISIEIKDLPTAQKDSQSNKLIEFGNCDVFVLSTRWNPKN